mgnify:CR=1 FL=1
METVGLTLAFFIIGGIGVTIGVYITSELKCSIRKTIMKNNLKKHDKRNTN